MKNTTILITNIAIILASLVSAILNAIDGLSDKINLIAFILSCLMIIICFIEIYIEKKKKK